MLGDYGIYQTEVFPLPGIREQRQHSKTLSCKYQIVRNKNLYNKIIELENREKRNMPIVLLP